MPQSRTALRHLQHNLHNYEYKDICIEQTLQVHIKIIFACMTNQGKRFNYITAKKQLISTNDTIN